MKTTRWKPSLADGAGAGACAQPDEIVKVSWGNVTIHCLRPGERLLRVLIVDNDRDAADSLTILVRMWGHDARTTYAGEAALRLADAYRPDVLLLDIGMPGMDGYQLARQLRQQARFARSLLIATTGYADNAHRQLGAEAGFDHYLAKPMELDALQELLLWEQHALTSLLDAPGTAARTGLLAVGG